MKCALVRPRRLPREWKVLLLSSLKGLPDSRSAVERSLASTVPSARCEFPALDDTMLVLARVQE